LDELFAAHAADIRGRVLEVSDPAFSERFGTDVGQLDLLDIDPTNDRATIIADLADPGCLPPGRFDCVIVPQTLQYVRDLGAACRNLWGALAPGGVLLVSVPAVAKLDHHLREVDRWRLTPTGLATLLEQCCDGGEVEVTGRGNVLVATAYLMGVAAEELDDAELAFVDPDFPVVVLARVRRPA
jgi:SAM-dependent methyltransferase